MGFSSIPLPRVVSDVGPGGPLVTSENALLNNQLLGAQARYAPQQAQANAFLTQQQARFLPYQQSMSILSNPMVWAAAKDNPEMMGQLKNMMMNMPSMGSQGGLNDQLMSLNPSNGSGNIFQALMQKLGIGRPSNAIQQGGMAPQQQTNSLMQSPVDVAGGNPANDPLRQISGNQPSPIVPASGGGTSGIMAAMTAPYTKSPYGGGVAIPDPNNPGKVIYTPTGRTTTAIQTQLLGEKRVEPQLERLAGEWAPFMDVKGMSDLTRGRIGSAFGGIISPQTLKQLGLEGHPELASQYAKAHATTKTAPEALVKAYGLNPTNETLERLETAVVPIWGEDKDSYKQRIKQTLSELQTEQAAPSKEALQQGFSSAPSPSMEPTQSIKNEGGMEGQEPPKGSVYMQDDQGNKYIVHESKIGDAINGIGPNGAKRPKLKMVG